jgi:hypothetical protein
MIDSDLIDRCRVPDGDKVKLNDYDSGWAPSK